MERKLASIQVVNALSPISGADLIEQANVLEWSMVVKKNEFKVGDLCVFFEIDSILPESDRYEFLRKSKFRIKTMKMRGTLAQGLALPLSLFPEISNPEVGQDVTEVLGVTKYEPPVSVSLRGVVEGNFPGYLSKTDEMRLQSFPQLLEECRDIPFYATVKADGTSATFSLLRGDNTEDEYKVCSRNLAVKDTEDSTYWQISRKYKIREFLSSRIGSWALQGEICGPGIHGNKLGLSELTLFVFNVRKIEGNVILGLQQMREFLEGSGIPMVTVDKENFLLNGETVKSLLKMADGFYPLSRKPREGLVFRPMSNDVHSPTLGGRLSFKVISNEFLLKNKE